MAAPEPEVPDRDVCRVLHGIRLVGFGLPPAIAYRARLDEERVAEVLGWLHERKYVAWHSGMATGWSLTAAGRDRGEELLRVELHASGAVEEVGVAYDAFLEHNQRFLELCTSWQLKTVGPGRFEPNGHDDPAYDAEVIMRLGETDDAIGPVLDRLAAAVERFGGYRPRFSEARQRIEHGDGDWFVRPVIDSYHTVWFELHEDLLATLGRRRNEER